MVEDEAYPKDILMANPEAMYRIILGLDKRVKDLEKNLRQITRELPKKVGKKGGSKKGRTGMTWTSERDVITKFNYVEYCFSCGQEALEEEQFEEIDWAGINSHLTKLAGRGCQH